MINSSFIPPEVALIIRFSSPFDVIPTSESAEDYATFFMGDTYPSLDSEPDFATSIDSEPATPISAVHPSPPPSRQSDAAEAEGPHEPARAITPCCYWDTVSLGLRN